MSLPATLWQANQDLAIACLQNPFVQGIGDGSLPRDRFAYYVGQDAFFLEAFARAYSVAAAKAPDWQAFEVFHNLAAGVLQELQMHQRYAAEWGVQIEQVQPGAATRQYTEFLGAIAWNQPVGVTAVAMLPCMKLYAFLGQELAATGVPDHAYQNWIDTYSGELFTPLVQQLEDLVERYATLTPLVQDTYRQAMQCELDFFAAAWEYAA